MGETRSLENMPWGCCCCLTLEVIVLGFGEEEGVDADGGCLVKLLDECCCNGDDGREMV